MPRYRYVKAKPTLLKKRSVMWSFVSMGVGLMILMWTLWPILSFSTITSDFLAKTVSPVADTVVYAGQTLSAVAHAKEYENPNSWYPTNPQKKVTAVVTTYSLTIPRLKITNATVTIAGDDLGKSLVHYGGTPLPGQYGNAVIFGHSTLPQLYNPKNYKTIFSLLPTMKVGDEIYATYDGIEYKYVVYDMIVVEPTDLAPLAQQFDDSYMTIVTCVPPGTFWKRLNVKARLVKNI